MYNVRYTVVYKLTKTIYEIRRHDENNNIMVKTYYNNIQYHGY